MFRKFFVVRTGVCGALFLGACALTVAKCSDTTSYVAPVAKANHNTPLVMADFKASDLVPFTEWNDITSHDTTRLNCSGGQGVTIDDVITTDKDPNGGLPTINVYEFLSVSQNGFEIAKNDIPDSRYLYEGGQSKDYTGEWVGKSSAGGKNANGDEVLFTVFTVRSADNKTTKYFLNTDTLAKGGVSVQYTCEAVK